jgi:hypothetical protein
MLVKGLDRFHNIPERVDMTLSNIYVSMGRLRGVFFKMPNSFFIAIFAIQPRKMTIKNTSSTRMPISRPGMPPTPICGEKSMAKIRMISAKFVLINAVIKSGRAKIAINPNWGGNLRALKSRMITTHVRSIAIPMLAWALLLSIDAS